MPSPADLPVELERTYAGTTSDLWAALTDPGRLASWFAPVEGELREGGELVLRFDDGAVPGCRVVRCDPSRSFAFEWPRGGEVSLVTVEITAAAPGARLRLRHTGLPPESTTAFAAGWDVYADRLAHDLAGRPVPDTWAEEFAAALAARRGGRERPGGG